MHVIARGLLIATLTWGIAACSDDGDGDGPGATPDVTPEVTPDATPEPSPVCTFEEEDAPIDPGPAHTPRWAFEPWISKDISDGPDTYAFVDGFIERDIPVGVVVIDSPWEVNYNDFVPNPERYPNFGQMVSDMHDRDVRVVLWTTQMVNRSSFDLEPGGDSYDGPAAGFEEGKICGFYVDEGRDWLWWKGFGAGVDFFNAKARAWWHRQQDPLYEMGIDGWKLDFGEEYIETDPMMSAAGMVSKQAYSEAYYEDFLAYGRQQRGRDFVTMVRPWDESYGFPGRFFARPEHSPVAWVGDNRRDWVGLIDALDHIFRSSQAGYVVVGSDIGGYLDVDDIDVNINVPLDQDNFVRWVGVGALWPFMQLHGRANLTPWTVPEKTEDTVRIYRYWSWLHHELVPFYYSLAEAGWASEEVATRAIIQPVEAAPEAWADDWRFITGGSFLVAPPLDGSGSRDVQLPAGDDWYDWWDQGQRHAGGTLLEDYDLSDQQHIPLFVRAGALVPASVRKGVTPLGTEASAGHLTLALWEGSAATSFLLYEEDDSTTQLGAAPTAGGYEVTAARAVQPLMLRFVTAPGRTVTAVRSGDAALDLHADRAAFDAADGGWFIDAELPGVWAKVPASAEAVSLALDIASEG